MDNAELAKQSKTEQFKFTGKAGEYFGIYIVNNIFTWLTLGIYSAWAKVRTLQYFYGNTELAGGHFQFTASPLKILRGRIIAVLLLILYFAVENVQSTLATVIFITMITVFIVFAPVLTVLVMSFKLRYSEWRGISFNFTRNYREAYRVYLIPSLIFGLMLLCLLIPFKSTEVEEFFGYESPVYQSEDDLIDEDETETYESDSYEDENSSYVDEGEGQSESEQSNTDEFVEESDDYYEDDYDYDEVEEKNYTNPYFFIPSAIFGLIFLVLVPYFDFINMRFLSRNARLGKARFNYTATSRDYYIVYIKWFAAILVLAALWLIEFKYNPFDQIGIWWLLTIISALAIPATRAYFKSQRYNLLLGKTSIDSKHQLNANTTFLGLLWLMVSNTVVIILSLGLMKPWAQIRTARYLLEHSSIDILGSLDDFVADQTPDENATMEEIADVFDLDILG